MLSCMQYAVKEGDCILSISKDLGFFWQTIWNDPQNASLKALRKDPNVLLAGDAVYIPDKQIKQVACPTDALHKFVRKGVPAMLRLQLLDRQHQPRTGLNYVLNIDGALISGTTDGNGYVVHPMPPNAQKAVLTVKDGDNSETMSIGLGAVDPITVTSGVQQRLKNLGFNAGPAGLSGALKAFQKKFGLPETGEADAATSAKLKDVHGC